MESIFSLREKDTHSIIFQPGERSCNRAFINKDGDLLFVATEKQVVGYNLFTESCFKIYEGHDGAIDDLAVDDNSTLLLSVGASRKILIHDIASGDVRYQIDEQVIDKACCFSPKNFPYIATVSSGQLKQQIILKVYKMSHKNLEPIDKIEFKEPINSIRWFADQYIIAGDESGRLHLILFDNN